MRELVIEMGTRINVETHRHHFKFSKLKTRCKTCKLYTIMVKKCVTQGCRQKIQLRINCACSFKK